MLRNVSSIVGNVHLGRLFLRTSVWFREYYKARYAAKDNFVVSCSKVNLSSALIGVTRNGGALIFESIAVRRVSQFSPLFAHTCLSYLNFFWQVSDNPCILTYTHVKMCQGSGRVKYLFCIKGVLYNTISVKFHIWPEHWFPPPSLTLFPSCLLGTVFWNEKWSPLPRFLRAILYPLKKVLLSCKSLSPSVFTKEK